MRGLCCGAEEGGQEALVGVGGPCPGGTAPVARLLGVAGVGRGRDGMDQVDPHSAYRVVAGDAHRGRAPVGGVGDLGSPQPPR